MISFIQGKIISKTENSIIVLTAGWVGYEVRMQVCKCASVQVGNEIGVHTYLAVRENAMELYGFENEVDKELFLQFLNVSGIGPKTAMHLLSLGSVDEISNAIGRGDVAYLTNVSGIGKKTAERIVVELKEKIKRLKDYKNAGGDSFGGVLGDVVQALIGLGYSADEAREVVKDLKTDGKDAGKLVKEALRRLGK